MTEFNFEDYSKEDQELIKEIVIARLEKIPRNWRLSIG